MSRHSLGGTRHWSIKKGFLSHTRRKTEIDYMQSIKKLFDPNNIMNPGKIF
ncbi:MAG: hypothetical protein HWD59_01160 [Coxiellaceae bacterium]|nr:MAG: hypothetical protein HWD59_01160 [Coxiellaceae bacterium]